MRVVELAADHMLIDASAEKDGIFDAEFSVGCHSSRPCGVLSNVEPQRTRRLERSTADWRVVVRASPSQRIAQGAFPRPRQGPLQIARAIPDPRFDVIDVESPYDCYRRSQKLITSM